MPTPAPETNDQRIARLRREHAANLAKLQAEGDARVKAVYASHTSRLDEWDLRQQFRREEDRVRQQTEDAVKLAYRRTGREYRKRLGLPLTVVHASELLADVIETDRMFADDAKVVRLRE